MDGVNWYRYVGGNPIIGIDPDGQKCYFKRSTEQIISKKKAYNPVVKILIIPTIHDWVMPPGVQLPGQNLVCAYDVNVYVTFNVTFKVKTTYYCYTRCRGFHIIQKISPAKTERRTEKHHKNWSRIRGTKFSGWDESDAAEECHDIMPEWEINNWVKKY